jgi:hypothetical protein
LLDRSISLSSRPTSSQCCRSTVSCSRTSDGRPKAFQMSAYFATVRSVLVRPLPPIMIGSRFWTGSGLIVAPSKE